MKNALIILLFILSTTVSATTYYIEPSGKDTNNGSSTSPWKSLAYACSRVKNSGDIIHINAGTYIETSQSQLAVGVSIEGVGITSIIKSHITSADWTIQLFSSTEGTNGNQHISNLKMDGDNLTGNRAIGVFKRSNVEIYNCTFVDFKSRGINFDGNASGAQPSVYATGNKFHNNTVRNCSEYDPPNDQLGSGLYLVGLSGQQNMSIYSNTLDQSSRAAGYNGYCIKAVGGFNKDIKIYDNTLTKNPFDGTTWDFAIEMWNCRGGIEIYNNVISAGIDFSGAYGNLKGNYAYGVWIHNNTIGPAVPSQTVRSTKGIYFEQTSEYVIVEKNYIKNMAVGVYFPIYHDDVYAFNTLTEINIRYNIFDNIGVADGLSSFGCGIYFNTEPGYANVADGFYVYNNVFIGHEGSASTDWGIQIPDVGTVKNVSIRNNIVENFDREPVYGSKAVSGLSIEKNIFYKNGHNNIPVYSGTGTVQNNLIGDPLFVSSSDFHLQTGSPGIGNGFAITGLTTDYAASSIKNPPSIGVYENSTAVLPPAVPVYQRSVVENLTPSKLEMTYDLNLNNLVLPAPSSFNVLVNSSSRTVNSVSISANKVQLTLANAIKFGDIITVSYTKPANSPILAVTGGVAASISSKSTINNVINSTKDATPAKIIMTISPNPVNRLVNILFVYASSYSIQDASSSPQIIRIFDISGKLFIEKLLVTGVTNVKLPINLKTGIYTVLLLSGGSDMSSQKIIVH